MNKTVLRELRLYTSASGEVPFSLWMEGFRDRSNRGIIVARLERLRLGLFGDYKNLGDGVFELRFHIGPGFRIYFGMVDDGKVILLIGGGDKSSQGRDIRKAKLLWQDYLQNEK